MILINLLPEDLRPIKRTPLPYVLVVALSLLAVAAFGSIYLNDLRKLSNLESEFEATSAELASLAHITTEYNQLEEQKLALADKVSVIQEILSDRKIWSELLQRLAALTPDNIWYKEIKVGSQNFRERVDKLDPKTGQPVINRATGQPETEIRTVRKPVLIVSGYAISNEQGVAQFYDLSRRTTADPEFSKHFKLDSPSMSDTEFEGFRVRSFSLVFEIIQGAKA